MEPHVGPGSELTAVPPRPDLAITRAETQLGQARRLFELAGTRVVDLPALVIAPVTGAPG